MTTDTEARGQALPATTGARATSRGKWWIIAAVAVVALLALAYLGAGAYIANQFTLTNHKRETATPASVGLTFDNVTFPSRDGLTLAGWYIPAPGAQSAVVMVHGYTSNRTVEFGGHFLDAARALHDHGYDVFMINMRGHGESGGERFSLGAKERLDVLSAVDWLGAKGISNVGVLGVSMGAAATAETAVDPDGGDRIKAVVLDSVFADSYDPVQREFSSTTGLPTWLLYGTRLMARLMYGVDIAGVRPAEDLPKIKAPVMLVFGTADTTVPPDQQQIVLAARPDADSWVVPGVSHASIYEAQPAEYNKRLLAFFDRALGAPQTGALPIEQTWLSATHDMVLLRASAKQSLDLATNSLCGESASVTRREAASSVGSFAPHTPADRRPRSDAATCALSRRAAARRSNLPQHTNVPHSDQSASHTGAGLLRFARNDAALGFSGQLAS